MALISVKPLGTVSVKDWLGGAPFKRTTPKEEVALRCLLKKAPSTVALFCTYLYVKPSFIGDQP